jgi:addiction module RelB/DinJ family antitoxin
MNSVISVRVDGDVKNSAQEVAKSIGLTLSALINAYLKQIAITRRIELYAPEQMTPNLEGFIAEIESELDDSHLSKRFTKVEDFLADLKK